MLRLPLAKAQQDSNITLGESNEQSTEQNEFQNHLQQWVYRQCAVFPETDKYEVAVMVGDRVVYDTPITGDIIRCETLQQAWDVVGRISMLPERGKDETVS